MKTIVIAILLSLILNVNSGYSQNFQWAQSASAASFASGNGVDVDAVGNVYTTGDFTGTANFNGQSLTSMGAQDMYIAKYNSSGIIQWTRKAGGASADMGERISTDPAGNSYVAGIFSGTVAFGSFNLTSVNYQDMFIAKYNSAGTVLWAVNAGRSNNGFNLQDITIDVSGNSYITGSYWGTANISTTALISSGLMDVFIAKFNSSGTFQWAKSGGGTGSDIGNSIAADNMGNVFITGNINNDAVFDNITISLNANDTANAFAVKYNSSGTVQWGIQMGGPEGDAGTGISTDNLGNCFITGSFKNNASFGAFNVTGYGADDIFITMCNPSGDFNWVETGGSTNWDYAVDIETNSFGDSYITGRFYGIATFGAFNLGNLGSDIYIVKYDKFGNAKWAQSAGGPGASVLSMSISSDVFGNAYVTGQIYGTVYFGNNNLSAASVSDAFTAKISPFTNLITGNVFIDYNNDGIKNGSDIPYPNRIVSLTPGLSYTTSNSSGDYYLSCGLGNYTMTLPNLPLYHTSNPVSQNAVFSSLNNIDANNDFAIHPIPGITDLKVSMTYLRRFVPGFIEAYEISYTNIGTTIESGYVELIYDNRLVYESSATIPPEDYFDLVTHTVRWNFSTLSPYDLENIHAAFTVPANLPVATTNLVTSASVHPVGSEFTPANNNAVLNHGLFNSHDPNDKAVEPTGNLTLQQLSAAEYLTYTVRFQNTGNNVAYTVSVLDKLSSKLDISSFEMLASSHNYTYSLDPDGTIDWTFNNILLPDNTTDELGSNGFIKYRIKPKNNVIVGDEIKNTAYIYFDYNVAVITNTTITKIVPPGKFVDMKFRLEAMHPNLDSIKVYLAKSVSPFEKIDSSTVYSLSDGTQFRAFPSFGKAVTGTPYYIVAKHRNSMETWSANPVMFISDTVAYDFTTSLNKAFGNNMVMVNGKASFFTGESENNGIVDLSDLLRIHNDAASFISGYVRTDLNGDGIVDLSDLLFAYTNSAKFVSIMKP